MGAHGRDPGARPLAGSAHVWFDRIEADGPDGPVTLPALAVDPAVIARLSAPRPALCGLSLDRPRIMGILNVTPDSFSDGGRLATTEALIARAQAMAAEADILDIGGESTRPGALPVPQEEEIARVIPAIRAIRAAGIATPISVDTRKAAVAAAALDAGADMVNDVSALTHDPAMAALVAERGVPVCLMHAQGDPQTMQDDPRYDDVVRDVALWLEGAVARAEAAGIRRDRIVLDPGIGFGKTLQHNVTILRDLTLYHDLGLPLLLGVSRKRFIGTIGRAEVAADRMPGSVAVALHGAAMGVHILRVHDTRETRQALSLHLAVNGT